MPAKGDKPKTTPTRKYLQDNGHVAGPTAVVVVVAVAIAWFSFYRPHSGAFDQAPLPVPQSTRTCPEATGSAPPTPVRVLPASGSGAIMNVYVGRDGNRAYGETPPLSIQGGTLCPGSVWPMRMSEFTRPDGQALRMDQVTSWARVDNNGTQLTVWVLVAPHHDSPVTSPGMYSGSVSLDSSVIQGALVPVRIHVPYQNVDLIFAFGLLAAFAGFIWATLIHTALGADRKKGYLFRNLALCVAVLLAAAIPVVNVQVLAKPDWQGTLSQFIALATLIGAAAIAVTPTLRALVLPKGLDTRDGAHAAGGARRTNAQAPSAAQAPGATQGVPGQSLPQGQTPPGPGQAPPGLGQPPGNGQPAGHGEPAVQGEPADGTQ